MKTKLFLLSVLFSVHAIAQPTVSGTTSVAGDTMISLPRNSITLTGTAKQANPGHPILDTTWTKSSGPAATITKSSNRMTTTVTGLVQGTYVFTLTARDKQSSSSSTVNVTVLPGILPIELAYFNVSSNDAGIMFTWQTNMESNNSHFVIQKSTDGVNFSDIASIASKAENGNSTTQLNYSYQLSAGIVKADMHYMLLAMVLLSCITLISKLNKIYKSTVLGVFCLLLFSCTKSVSVPSKTASVSAKTEYRLKQIDLDGSFTYSAIKFAN